MAKAINDKSAEVAALYQQIAALNMEPIWLSLMDTTGGTEPSTPVSATIWRWRDYYPLLHSASELIELKGAADRRSLDLINPGVKNSMKDTGRMGICSVTQSLQASVQIVAPGEVAPAHRHTFSAFRFIISGRGAITTVEGERHVLEEGDLVLTPSWTWHDHIGGTEPVIWLDGLDLRLVRFLESVFWEPYPKQQHPVTKPDGYSRNRVGTLGSGLVRYGKESYEARVLPLIYKWEETEKALVELAERSPDPFEGAILDYVNPVTGGPTFPTMICRIQRLAPQQVTLAHRHTGSVFYHVRAGQGYTIISGQKFEWEKGDCFTLPSWAWHEHANSSSNKEAYLFSFSDQPMHHSLGLYREEAKSDDEKAVLRE